MRALGIDIGTTSISMALVDADSGALVAHETVNHDSFIQDGCPAGKAQDPERIWAIVREKYEALARAHGRPACVGMTGQMHGMLYVDASGRAVSPLYTWQDGRGNLPMADGRSYAQCLRDAGLSAASGYGLTTHFWLSRNGQVPANAAGMTTVSDYVAMKLTGRTAPALGADMAASWGGFDLEARAFRREALAAAGVDIRLLPEVLPGHAILGQTPDGVPVTLSLGDNQASVIGSVRDIAHTVLINVGTGSQVSFGVRRYFECLGDIELRPCTADTYICVGSGLCGGRAYALLERFYREAAGETAPCYDRMLSQAQAFVDEYGPEAAWRVRTTFSGTRSDPAARGSAAGIGVENFRPGALTVGVIAGILGELYEEYARMREMTGARASVLVGSGNGLRRNPLMRRLAEDRFGLPLHIPAHREEAAYGAALAAMAAAGLAPSLAEAQKRIRYE